jgi:hypothetical protein
MKKNYLILFVCIALSLSVNAQTDNGQPRNIDLIPAPKTNTIVPPSPAPTSEPMLKGNHKFKITFRITNESTDSTATLEVTENGKLIKRITNKGLENSFELELNTKYLFTCTKKGFITKAVLVDTHVPPSNEDDLFGKFKAIVSLKKEDGQTKPYTHPVGYIKYSKVKQDFDFDKDYK